MSWKGVIDAYRSRLPEGLPDVTLHEGNTPLIYAPRMAEALGGGFELYLKYEAVNPTGSFKDRGMAVAMAAAKMKGKQIVICASTGNTSASAAAYAARIGVKAAVILPAGKIALGKLAQALIYGARIVPIRGNFDDALRLVREMGMRPEIEVVNSINPSRIEGQKTAAFEICDVLGRAPDYHFLPVGNAGNITAYWKGYQEYHADGLISALPHMMGWQAAGAAPIVDKTIISHPETVASAIRIGNPASWRQAEEAIAHSSGHIGKVSDDAILAMQKKLASTEGIFVEPACAAPLVGLAEFSKNQLIPKGALVVATMTGHGLKDPDTAMRSVDAMPAEVDPSEQAVLEAIGSV